MQIGRRIYYRKSTGEKILDTGQREGEVYVTTIDQDFQDFQDLRPFARDAVGVVTLAFGEQQAKFDARYNYHIDPATEQIVWDLTPIQQEEQTKQLSQQEQIDSLNKQMATTNDTVDFILGM